MKLYKVYRNKVCSVEVKKETKCYYFIEGCFSEFDYSTRIDKEDALLTPQEAIQNALNHARTMYGAYRDKMEEKGKDIDALNKL